MDRYNKILEKFLASHTSELAKEVLADLEKRAKLFSTYSSRHHYIPQHYIKGFTGEDGLLSVYDKKTDTIKTKRFAPKGVFYESDRNSFQVDDINISILEDYMFAKYDTEFAKCIRDLRNSPNTEELLSIENQAMLSAFIVDLFWRNPLTDYAFEDLLARSVITFTDTQTGKAYTDIEKERELRNDPVHKKIERAKMTLTAINNILSERKQGTCYSKMWTFGEDLFVLGDYPMLFENTPSTHSDLFITNFYVPISSTRVYSNHRSAGLDFDRKDAYLLNALIIAQSKNIVCCGNPNVLAESVRCFKSISEQWLETPLKKALFLKAQIQH